MTKSPTGRLGTRKEPNIQNIPIRTPEGAEIKDALAKDMVFGFERDEPRPATEFTVHKRRDEPKQANTDLRRKIEDIWRANHGLGSEAFLAASEKSWCFWEAIFRAGARG